MDHDDRILEALDDLRKRVGFIEERLGIAPAEVADNDTQIQPGPGAPEQDAQEREEDREEELEYELGQGWFARVGIAVLALGIAFLLTLPFEEVPQIVVSVFGYALAVGLFYLSRTWRESLTLLSNYLRGAGIALMYFATLRLTYFSAQPVLPPDALLSHFPLLVVSIASFILSARRGSMYLTLLAFILGYTTLVVVHSPVPMFVGLILLAAYAAHLFIRHRWTGLLLSAMALSAGTYLHWGIGQPLLSGTISAVDAPEWGLIIPILVSVVFAGGVLQRRNRDEEGYSLAAAGVLGGGSGYALVLLLTLLSFDERFVLWHVMASVAYLGVAVAFWVRERSRYSTFLYAMLGYKALTVALLKAFEVPEVFVWLSVQSLVVVVTAVWFRSRFIVVVNFFIYVVIFFGYLLVAEQESGFSFGFGIVALVSARILNWQRQNLELKTDAMRNSYLVSAFVVIPYSLYHFVPSEYTALSWVGVALLYYLMSAVINNQKYRWMGHFTLMLTALYVVAVGIVQLDTTFRVISFLVLGIVLLGTSIFFTRKRLKKGARSTQQD